ncbi:DUF2150 family protein [Natronomonas sp. EA1]|uniref:DUF2150 family protein n=1 Tax=Natronomonas sp. EA1 TaxID=3421655 RepID=UPI003EBD48E4
MSDPAEEYYTEERWNNWLDRLREEELDPENEDSARLLLNLQDDAAIAIAKIITDFDEGEIDEERALDELGDIADIVLADAGFEDEDTAILVDGVQMSLHCVIAATETYFVNGPLEGDVTAHIDAAAEAEAEEDLDTAFSHCAQAGTLIIDGAELDMSAIAEDLEYGYVAEWVNGLDSLQDALSTPEVVEEN